MPVKDRPIIGSINHLVCSLHCIGEDGLTIVNSYSSPTDISEEARNSSEIASQKRDKHPLQTDDGQYPDPDPK